MAGNVKGITIELNAETKNFNKALKDISTSTKSLETELRSVNAALKLDPKNVELLKQKQDLLTKAVDESKQSLKVLKDTKDKADKDMASGTQINQEQYRKLQREIAFAEGKVKNFEQATKNNTEAIKKSAREIDKFNENVKKVSLVAGATVIAGGAASFKLASDYEESLNKVDVAFKNNSGEVKKWAKTTLEQFGISKGTALDIAALYGDMGTSMGLSTGNAAKMSTNLTGLAADLASFKNVGIDQASDALKGIFTGEGESLKSLGIIMQDTTLKQYAVSNGYKKSYEDMTQSEKVQLRYNYVMESTKNAQGDFARTSDGAANSLRIMKETSKEAGIELGQQILPAITKVVQKVSELVKWIVNNKTKVLASLAAISAGLIALNVTLMIQKVVKAFQAWKLATEGMTISQRILNLVMKANPIGIIVTLIAALVAAFVVLWNNCEGFRNFWIGLWNGIVNVVKAVINWVKENWKTIILFFINPVGAIFKYLYDHCDAFRNFINNVLSAIGGFFKNIWNGILNVARGAFNGIIAVVNFFKNVWTEAWSGMKNIFSAMWNGLVNIAKGPINLIIGLINSLIGGINYMISGLNKVNFEMPEWDWLPNAVQGKSFGINIPKIDSVSYLAEGGILNRPTLLGISDRRAQVGGEAGAEAVIPLSKLPQLMAEMGYIKPQNIETHIEMNGRETAVALTPYINKQLAFGGR